MTVTRRTILAAPLILPIVPALAAPQGRALGGDLAYLASNLRRADDKARRIAAPLDTAAAWHWITTRAASVTDLDPLNHADLIADIEGMEWEERRALHRQFIG